jgi:hypothetical protein
VRFALSVLELAEAVGQLKTLRLLNFVKAFCTDSRKINDLALTVDQEVGGSNPPSCTTLTRSIRGAHMPAASAALRNSVIFARSVISGLRYSGRTPRSASIHVLRRPQLNGQR